MRMDSPYSYSPRWSQSHMDLVLAIRFFVGAITSLPSSIPSPPLFGPIQTLTQWRSHVLTQPRNPCFRLPRPILTLYLYFGIIPSTSFMGYLLAWLGLRVASPSDLSLLFCVTGMIAHFRLRASRCFSISLFGATSIPDFSAKGP